MKNNYQKPKRNLFFSTKTPKYSGGIKGWTAIRETILERDNYCCRICGMSAGDETLHVHHIDWDRAHNDDSNLVTLCMGCHRQVHLEHYKPADHPDHPAPWGTL